MSNIGRLLLFDETECFRGEAKFGLISHLAQIRSPINQLPEKSRHAHND